MSETTVRRRGLRERIEKTRHRYWGKSGQVNVPELTDQILTFLHEQGVKVADDDWECRAGELQTEVDELQQLRRWLRAVSLGRATKEIHAEIRAYLEQEVP